MLFIHNIHEIMKMPIIHDSPPIFSATSPAIVLYIYHRLDKMILHKYKSEFPTQLLMIVNDEITHYSNCEGIPLLRLINNKSKSIKYDKIV